MGADSAAALKDSELTSILIPSCRLRITALLSSSCRAAAETLSSVHSSSTVAELPRSMPIARVVSAKFKAFSFSVIKSYSAINVIPLFRIPRFTASQCSHCFWSMWMVINFVLLFVLLQGPSNITDVSEVDSGISPGMYVVTSTSSTVVSP